MKIFYDPNSTWAALYGNDGKLETMGDSSHVEERALELADVEVEHDDAFLCGGKTRADVASTLEAVQTYADARNARQVEADHLERQAHLFLARAKELRQ